MTNSTNLINLKKKNLVILTSGDGSNLQAIIDEVEKGTINAVIKAVISNKQSYSLQRAKNHQIPAIWLAHTDYPTREAYDSALLDTIMPYQPDFIILAGFMRILTPFFIEKYPNKIINIHPSLLPKYKGLNTHKQALDAKDTEHGCSVHFVTEALDSGDLIAQSTLKIDASDTPESLAKRVQVLEHKLYPSVIRRLCSVIN